MDELDKVKKIVNDKGTQKFKSSGDGTPLM